MEKLRDSSIFPYGAYKNKGYTMEEVPAWYLLKQYKYFSEKGNVTLDSPVHRMMDYVKENQDVLDQE